MVNMNLFDGTVCVVCLQWKPLSQYRPQRRLCRTCLSLKQKEYYPQHQEYYCQQAKKNWRKGYAAYGSEFKKRTPEQRIADNQKTRERRRKNPEKVQAAHREYHRAHPEKSRFQTQCYNARKKAVGGSVTAVEWAILKELLGNCCLRCKVHEDSVKLTMDHVVPLAKKGPHSIYNIQPLCGPCNSGKKDCVQDYRYHDEQGKEVFEASLRAALMAVREAKEKGNGGIR